MATPESPLAAEASTPQGHPKNHFPSTDSAREETETMADTPEDIAEALGNVHELFAGAHHDLDNLLAIVKDALEFSPPLYLNSILGSPWGWIPPHKASSEFSIVNIRQVARSLSYLTDVTVPALPLPLPEGLPGFGDSIFWRPTEIFFQPDPNDNPYSFPDEAWIFINGIATNYDLAKINAEFLTSMFRRPMTIIQNATDSVTVDLLESVIGKAWAVTTEASAKAYPFILHALNDRHKKRVVVICHSQGTIVMSNVLRALVDDQYRLELDKIAQKTPRIDDEEVHLQPLERAKNLSKLEIYAFANAATIMPQAPNVHTKKGNRVPWIESYGNEFDLVARLGMLAPKKEQRGIRIDGDSYMKKGMWGHCLNVHYLWGLQEHLQNPQKVPNPYLPMEANGAPGAGHRRPRLFDYFAGQRPERY